jgi:5-methylcytosine-specific restriction endonuclease McrA
MSKELQPCGTRAAYRRHNKNKETPCPECISANNKYSLSLYHKNPAVSLKSSSLNYYNNIEKRRKQISIWKQNNKDKKNTSDLRAIHRRRARKLNNGFEKYSELDVISLYGSICHICNIDIDLSLPRKTSTPGWEMGLHIDHLIPISKGGPDTVENVRPAHGICNLKKHAKTLSK